MDFPQIWPHLSTSSRSWLMEHNGEPLPDDLTAEILSVTGGEQSPQWWTGPSVEGETQLTRADSSSNHPGAVAQRPLRALMPRIARSSDGRLGASFRRERAPA
jgi:hypothetical protein